MSLAQVLYPSPGDPLLVEWSFNHYQHHQAINEAIFRTKKVQLVMPLIYPLNIGDIENWLQLHQTLHDEMESVFNIMGNDLSSLDFADTNQRDGFFFLNYSSHRDVAIAAGLPA